MLDNFFRKFFKDVGKIFENFEKISETCEKKSNKF